MSLKSFSLRSNLTEMSSKPVRKYTITDRSLFLWMMERVSSARNSLVASSMDMLSGSPNVRYSSNILRFLTCLYNQYIYKITYLS